MHTDTHVHTLFLIWPIKRCVFVNRENFVGGADIHARAHTNKHTHPAGPVLGKVVTCTTENNERHV